MRGTPILLLVAWNLAAAQTPGGNADSAAIATLEQRIEDAMVRRDATFLETVYAPTFRFKHSTGSLETRAERMTSVRSQVPPDAPGRFIARTVDSLDVEIHNDVALTTGRIHVRRDGGDPRWRDYTVRYARIYRRGGAGGRWQLLTHHSTAETQGPPAPFPASVTTSAARDTILGVIQTFFETMAAKDVEGARRVLVAEGRFHAVREQNGAPAIRSFTNAEYLTQLQQVKEALRERMWDPEVRIRGSMASVWTPYDFWLDGKRSHCGIDAFDLVRTPEGWKIAGGVYTVESQCAPSPLGPLNP